MNNYYCQQDEPNRYRCFQPLSWSAITLLFAWAYGKFMEVNCGIFASFAHGRSCPVAEMPQLFFLTLVGLFVYGIIGFAYRAYRDFYRGDYFLDHPHF